MTIPRTEKLSRAEEEVPENIDRNIAPETVKTSVIIVNYNGQAYIDACLMSLMNSLPRQSEVILVDNASPDRSGHYIEERYPDIKVIHSSRNMGFGRGNNLGVEHAQGEYLVFLNPDTCVTEGWLDALLWAMEDIPNAGMATSKLLLDKEPELINACGNDMHFTGLTLCRGALSDANAPEYNQQVEVGAVSGAAFVMRKSLFDDLGGFDPLMFMYMEDTDLSLRVRLAGNICVYVPESVVLHDYSLSFGPLKTYYQERNRYIMMLKSFHWRTLILLILPLLLAEVTTWGFVIIKERHMPANKLKAYWGTLQVWRTILVHRRDVQSTRTITDRELLKSMTYRIDFEQTGHGLASSVGHLIFDPLFYVMYRFLLLIVRW